MEGPLSRFSLLATRLADLLALIERGWPPYRPPRRPIPAEVAGLLDLAIRLRRLAPVQPNPAWLNASRERVLAELPKLRYPHPRLARPAAANPEPAGC